VFDAVGDDWTVHIFKAVEELPAIFLLGLLFDTEDESDMLHQNNG
jgi:hypothetical protein